MIKYFKNLFVGIWYLLQGMNIVMRNFFRRKVTEQYPENRGKVFPYERMRGQLIMNCNEADDETKCTACALCESNCPNGAIQIVSKKITDELTGKEKRILDKFTYDLGCCIFCSLCTISCPHNAITWSANFEHALFTKSKLVIELNPKKI